MTIQKKRRRIKKREHKEGGDDARNGSFKRTRTLVRQLLSKCDGKFAWQFDSEWSIKAGSMGDKGSRNRGWGKGKSHGGV